MLNRYTNIRILGRTVCNSKPLVTILIDPKVNIYIQVFAGSAPLNAQTWLLVRNGAIPRLFIRPANIFHNPAIQQFNCDQP